MTEREHKILTRAVAVWREQAEPHGSMHPLWDAISDAESLLKGGGTLLSKDVIIEMALRRLSTS